MVAVDFTRAVGRLASFIAGNGKARDAGNVASPSETPTVEGNLDVLMDKSKQVDLSAATVSGPRHTFAPREGRMEFTPQTAQQVLTECAVPYQRPMKRGHAGTLAMAMKKDAFTAGTQLHFCRIGRRFYLVNGYHRLTALIDAGVSLVFQVLVSDCESDADVARHYYRHDTVIGVRTLSDVVRAAGVGDDESLSASDAHKTLSAVKVIVGRFSRSMAHLQEVRNLRQPDEILTHAAPWWQHAKTYFQIIDGAAREARVCLSRQHIVACGLITVKYQPEKAAGFWGGIAADDGLRKGDPRKSALHYMLQNGIGFGGNSLAWAGAAGVSLCWNAWFRGDTLSLVRAATVADIVLSGTPVGRRARK